MRVLLTSKLFTGLNASELDRLQKSVKVLDYPPGHVILREGESGDGIYLVRDGAVQISALVSQGERRSLSRLVPGDFFGEMAVLDDEPRSASATTDGTASVYFLPRQVLWTILESSPRLALNLVREFSRRMRDFNRQYINEVLQSERLALVGRFARSIVHDFKNPLNVIGIASEMAGMDSATPEIRKSAARRIRKQVDRLSNMINELLEFTRGSQNATVFAETDYATFVRDLIEEVRAEVIDKGVIIECGSEPPPLTIRLDPHRLSHVFYNLVHNAVDAMPTGGKITLRFFADRQMVRTEIEDSGKGIAPEIRPRLFEAFATYGKAQGTGLGLSICRRIIDDHQGRIWAENGVSGGAVFCFCLPLQQSST